MKKIDDIFDDFEGDDLEQYVGKTSDTHENAFCDPDRHEEHRHLDIGSDLGIIIKYSEPVDFPGFTMTDDDYNKIMQPLNVKQNELCNDVIYLIHTREESMHIFVEGDARVGKAQVAEALYESMIRYYSTQ